jgi:hypothetical protein
MKSAYIERHNKAVRMIFKTLQAGPHGSWCAVMDAGKKENLPPGVTPRMPDWSLTDVPDGTRDRMRPDIAIIEGVTPQQAAEGKWPTSHEQRSKCTVHLFEVGYTGDTRHAEKHAAKTHQHSQLAVLLRAAGWQVTYAPSPAAGPNGRDNIFTLGVAGTIPKTLAPRLAALSAPRDEAQATCKALHLHAVKTAHSITTLRRSLQRPP